MIYSINEGVLDKFKKGNTTESEFNIIFTNLNKLIRSLENNESKFASSNKGLKRLREHENNNIEKIKNDFLNGNPSFIVYHMIFEMESSTKDSKIDNKQSVVNTVKQFATSCGFKDINTAQNKNIYLEARNSEKYPTFIIELSIFKHPKRGEMVDIGLFSDRNTCRLKKESAKNESVVLYGSDADNFLESIGVDINLENETISIGEMVMDGITGENILAENGITLNEDHIVLEGKQAEEYKRRKIFDKYDKMDEEEKESIRHGFQDEDGTYVPGKRSQMHGHYIPHRTTGEADKLITRNTTINTYKDKKDRSKEMEYAHNVANKAYKTYDADIDLDDMPRVKGSPTLKGDSGYSMVTDTARRHYRRHVAKAKNESTIFKYADFITE